MNEWLPKGYYSGSAATADPRPQTRAHRQSWEENWDQNTTKTNARWIMNGYKVRDYQHRPLDTSQFLTEDIGIPPTCSPKKKKNGAADPRFRRVINTEYRSETEMERDKLGLIHKVTSPLYDESMQDGGIDEKVISFFKIPNDSSFFTSPNPKKAEDQNDNCKLDSSNEVTKDTGFQSPSKYYGPYDATFTCENLQEMGDVKAYQELEKVKSTYSANLKRSASDCTLNKKKSFADENEDETSGKVRAYPSATRLAKVHNWIKDYNVFPEKRRSVITVIGQTQTKPFSKILSEINQRRKLAKELDRHALCEAIMESAESQSDMKNLVAKVDLVLPDGKVIYSTEKVYLRRDNKFTDAGVYTHQSMETLDACDEKKKTFQMIPERGSSVSQLGKKSRTRRSSRKTVSPLREKLKVKGSIKGICASFSSIIIWSFLAVLCLSLCFSLFFYSVKPSQTYFLVEFFKPKTTAWYEKLLF